MRKIIHIFLSLVIVYASTTSAYANTSIGGWTATDSLIAGANTTINAAKTAGGKALKSSITVAASASKVGKHLIKGGGSAALAYAMVELADNALDWVLDPANNRVKYTVAGDIGDDGSYYFEYAGKRYSTHDAACNAALMASSPDQYHQGYRSATWTDEHRDLCRFAKPEGGYTTISGISANRKGGGGVAAPPVEKYIPIDVVAAKVISNAEAGHAPSQEAVKATALEGFAAGEHDAALDAAATETGTENPPDTENPPKDPDAPAEPFDPAGIISAINALKALLAGILSSITGLADIFNSDPPPEKTQKETDVPVDDLPPTKGASDFDVNYINFGGQCPVLPSFDVGIGGASSTLTFDMTPLCDMAVKIRPAVIAIAYFIGLGVIASAIRET